MKELVKNKGLIVFVVLLAFYQIFRIQFLYMHSYLFENDGFLNLTLALLHGFRFDVSTLLMINFPFLLYWLVLPKTHLEKVNSCISYLFLFVNFLGFIVLTGDLEYFNFTGRKLTKDVFAVSDDAARLSGAMVFYYWYLFVLPFMFLFILFKLLKTHSYRFQSLNHVAKVIFIIVLVVGVRGGFQLKPLRSTHAFVFNNTSLGFLSLNSVFTLIRSKAQSKLKNFNEFTEDELLELLPNPQKRDELERKYSDHNVVVIVLESFADEYLNDYAPFLSQLADKGQRVSFGFANGRRSIEAVTSILSSVPSLMRDPLIKSSYASNKLQSIANVLNSHGYKSSFFHGGENGTMFFDSYAQRTGFAKYYGRDEYPNEGDFDGNWGIFDEEFFQFTVEKVSGSQKPFFAFLFSLSSHHPYSVPKKYKGKFPKGKLEIHESIGYTDYSLKKFFETAETKEWFKNTLFVITSDHINKLEKKQNRNHLGNYRVPIIFFHPQSNLPKIHKSIGQHTDIVPSIAHLLGIELSKKWPSTGESLFNRGMGRALNRADPYYWYLRGDRFFMDNLGGAQKVFSVNKNGYSYFEDEMQMNSLSREAREMRAMIQYFNSSLNHNRWF